jgi:hypothetical protein
MADHLFGAIELGLVFGGVVAWGAWELRATQRARRESERRLEARREEAPPADEPGER